MGVPIAQITSATLVQIEKTVVLEVESLDQLCDGRCYQQPIVLEGICMHVDERVLHVKQRAFLSSEEVICHDVFFEYQNKGREVHFRIPICHVQERALVLGSLEDLDILVLREGAPSDFKVDVIILSLQGLLSQLEVDDWSFRQGEVAGRIVVRELLLDLIDGREEVD